MAVPIPFPLNIPVKQDSWEKEQLLQYLDASLYYTSSEFNKIVDALDWLFDNGMVDVIIGNIPSKIKNISIDHTTLVPSDIVKMKDGINVLPNFILKDSAFYYFTNRRVVLTNGAYGFPRPGGFYAIVTDFYVLNKKLPRLDGVVSVGIDGTEIFTGDLLFMFSIDNRSFEGTTFEMGNIGTSEIWSSVDVAVAKSTPNGAVIVFNAIQNGNEETWLWKGDQEEVGLGKPATSPSDFKKFNDNDLPPGYQETLPSSFNESRTNVPLNNHEEYIADQVVPSTLNSFVTSKHQLGGKANFLIDTTGKTQFPVITDTVPTTSLRLVDSFVFEPNEIYRLSIKCVYVDRNSPPIDIINYRFVKQNFVYGLPSGSGSTSEIPSDDQHVDITALIADQNNQIDGEFHLVNDATDDPDLTSGWAIYDYLGTTNGDLTDYVRISEENTPSTGGGGIVTQRIAFTEALKFDKSYFSTDALRHPQTAPINFTLDVAGALINGSHIQEITSNGDPINFTLDFGSLKPPYLLTGNSITSLIAGKDYEFIHYYTGVKVNTVVSEIKDISLPILNSPLITSVVFANSTDVTVTINDTNAAPNEVNTEIEWSIKNADVWVVGLVIAQNVTSGTIIGLSDVNEYDFRAIAKGDNVISVDSIYSNIYSLNLPSSIIILEDPFNDSSVDAALWDSITIANGVISENGTNLELSATASTGGYFGLQAKNPIVMPISDILIVQMHITFPSGGGAGIRLGLTTEPIDLTELLIFAIPTAAPFENVRALIKDGGTNEVNLNAPISTGRDFRMIHVPTTGASSYEYHNGTDWIALPNPVGGAPITGNIALGASVNLQLQINPTAVYSGIQIKDLFVSNAIYETKYPS